MTNDKESTLIWEAYTGTDSNHNESTQVNEAAIDKVQAALDVIGMEPTVGTGADVANTLISSFRAALADEKDERKKHIINAAISAVSIIPGADVIKFLKLGRPAKKLAVKGLKAARKSATGIKQSGERFAENREPSGAVNPSGVVEDILGEILFGIYSDFDSNDYENLCLDLHQQLKLYVDEHTYNMVRKEAEYKVSVANGDLDSGEDAYNSVDRDVSPNQSTYERIKDEGGPY